MRAEDITFGWFLSTIACLDSLTAIKPKGGITLASEQRVCEADAPIPLLSVADAGQR